jgi:hypothetical protein
MHVLSTNRMLFYFFPFALIETWHCASSRKKAVKGLLSFRALKVTVLKICAIYNSLSSLEQNDGNPLGRKVAIHQSRCKTKQSDDDNIAPCFRLTLTIELTRSQSGTESSPI